MSINETVYKTIICIQNNSQINSFTLLIIAVQNPSVRLRYSLTTLRGSKTHEFSPPSGQLVVYTSGHGLLCDGLYLRANAMKTLIPREHK